MCQKFNAFKTYVVDTDCVAQFHCMFFLLSGWADVREGDKARGLPAIGEKVRQGWHSERQRLLLAGSADCVRDRESETSHKNLFLPNFETSVKNIE